MPEAMALVTSAPAAACGLDDRGRIEVGRRADLIAVDRVNGMPLVSRTWTAGRLVFATHYAPPVATARPNTIAADRAICAA